MRKMKIENVTIKEYNNGKIKIIDDEYGLELLIKSKVAEKLKEFLSDEKTNKIKAKLS